MKSRLQSLYEKKRPGKIFNNTWLLFKKKGKKHSVFYNPKSNKSSTVPIHNEINNYTAKGICRDLEIPVIDIK